VGDAGDEGWLDVGDVVGVGERLVRRGTGDGLDDRVTLG